MFRSIGNGAHNELMPRSALGCQRRSSAEILFRLLRMGKLTRAIRVVSMTSVLALRHRIRSLFRCRSRRQPSSPVKSLAEASLQLLIKCLAASRDMFPGDGKAKGSLLRPLTCLLRAVES